MFVCIVVVYLTLGAIRCLSFFIDHLDDTTLMKIGPELFNVLTQISISKSNINYNYDNHTRLRALSTIREALKYIIMIYDGTDDNFIQLLNNYSSIWTNLCIENINVNIINMTCNNAFDLG